MVIERQDRLLEQLGLQLEHLTHAEMSELEDLIRVLCAYLCSSELGSTSYMCRAHHKY